jgi:hypothetical protein
VSGRLELRFRRLLWAYPRAYRNHRGAEIVTTLLEMAESGHARPTRRLAWHLIVCGLQQRFRLPARRPLAWLGALLTAGILGAFGASGGTLLGWQTAASLPSGHELGVLNDAMGGMSAPAVMFHNRSAMKGPDSVATSEGTGNYSADRVRSALTAAGWQVTSLHERDGAILVGTDTDTDPGTGMPGVRVATRSIDYTATKSGLKLSGEGSVITGGADRGLAGTAAYSTDVWPREAAAVRPLTIVGLIVGALIGWLVAAAFAQRLRGRGRLRRGLATASCAVALTALAVPACVLYRDEYQVMAYAHGSPVPYVVYSPDYEIPVGSWIVGLLAVIAALVAVRWPRHVGAAPTGPDAGDGTAVPELG